MNEYHGRILLLHLDLYRLETGEANALGLEDYAGRGALVVEWGEKLPAVWQADALRLAFDLGPDTVRRITAEAATGRGLELLGAWRGIAATADARPS
jgi:tRNA threonylcarbamoyladenosine biosynthesis protein TsaE